MIKLITYTTLYPSCTQARHGIFVENRLKHLLGSKSVQSIVVAPVPWFPFTSKRFGNYAKFANTPKEETRHGIRILHPRYLVIPKIGMSISPFLLALGSWRTIRKIIKEGYEFESIDAHYFYPDGVAACILSKVFKKKLVITARGSDINYLPKFTLPRKLILWAENNCNAIITVSTALKDNLILLGANREKISVLRNGVNLDVFKPKDRTKIPLPVIKTKKCLLSAGNLIESKGHHIVIDALQHLTNCSLIILGTGKLETKLKNLCEDLNVTERVIFTGEVSHDEMLNYYNLADILVLASSREGMANVILESIACGTPVVAYDTGGASEIIKTDASGKLVPVRSTMPFVDAITNLLENLPIRSEVRNYAQNFCWDHTTEGQIKLFSNISSD